MQREKLSQLKKFLKDQKIDFFLLPNSDEFFSEYLPEKEKRVQHLTGFTGSNATVIFGQEKSYFFTDGRYILQANQQLNLNEFEIFNIAEKSVLAWIESEVGAEKKLALDAKLSSVEFVKKLISISSRTASLIGFETTPACHPELVSGSVSQVFSLPENLTGLDSLTKRAQILQGLEADFVIITKPENLCWLLNIRAADVEFTPLLLAYGILFKSGEVDLFLDEKRTKNLDLSKVNFVQTDCLDLRISVLRKKFKKVQIDERTTNYWLYRELERNNFEIISKTDSCEILKSQKNSAEIFGAIKAHEADGIALTKFLFWLENCGEIDEIKAAEKLLELRKRNPNFLYPSFATIAGFASNGAVIHYHATQETNKKISGDSLFLIDSGGQYFGANFCGTTDVTRTIAIGNPTSEMIENFTRVLKGHIALARAKFPRGTVGAQLDALARNHLWQVGLDFDHGTGHGVGSFLSVHEGPQSISRRSSQPLLPGMILSNEPGFYKNGEYGIRIENLMLVEEFDEKFLQFKTLTLVPIDSRLIDFKMLTRLERKWLYEYHQMIFDRMEFDLNKEEKTWLKNLVQNLAIIL